MVRRGRRADVQHIDRRKHLFHRPEYTQPVLRAKAFTALRAGRSDTCDLHMRIREIFEVEFGGKACPGDSDFQG